MVVDVTQGSVLPRFGRELSLPGGGDEVLAEAAIAIKHEHRAASEWKQFRCVDVVVVDRAEGLYRLDTGTELGLDAWEGSTAHRPLDLGSLSGEPVDAQSVWSGAVVEADDARGSLFVAVENGRAPCRGTFYVRPFEFTAMLNRIYGDPQFTSLQPLLRDRLHACERGVDLAPSLPDPWPVGWSLLWGPPGTGKTRLIGERVAKLLDHECERVLVISTTNDATDAAALSIGRALPGIPHDVSPVVRVGRGARYRRYAEANLHYILESREHELRNQIEGVRAQLEREPAAAERARLRRWLGELVRELRGAAAAAVRDARRRVLVTTAFHAMSFVAERNLLDQETAPFTTVVIDEAGLLSRATLAALSLLAARRVVLVGDPKQLAPISRMSRVLPSDQGRWLALSALHHLDLDGGGPGRELLTKQHRMHPDIREAVSRYQYGGRLEDGASVGDSDAELPAHRAIWYVLDEDRCERHQLRAERGPFHRSWVRTHTREVLERLLATYPALREASGLFLSPFVGQCREIRSHLADLRLTSWRSSTVHQQQGAEADVVVFDTVNAGSHCWPSDEWERLINVAASRARKLFVLLATREEVGQTFLAPLVPHLWPAAFKYIGKSWELTEVQVEHPSVVESRFEATDPRLGAQISRRRALRPILSAEQQRLCHFDMDGKPRLVRGVAGSGKTVVLANWLVQTYLKLKEQRPRLWVVYANESLRGLMERTILDAWQRAGQRGSLPSDCIVLRHIDKLLADLERPAIVPSHLRFEYHKRAIPLLNHPEKLTPSCDALFIDEAQDLGAATIRLLTQLVKHRDPDDPKSRAVNVFYDNAQNVYGRGTPKWIDLGIDVRGRSVVMKESFRSTKPITEFALNTLARLMDFDGDPDQREYRERGLIEATQREGHPWWSVKFNEIDGPTPQFKKFADREREILGLCRRVTSYIKDEQVSPSDIAILTMGKLGRDRHFGEVVAGALSQALAPLRLRAEYRTSEGFVRDGRTVIVSTPHSFKGYEAEIVYVPGVDMFVSNNEPNAASLYVALTRARSLLVASGIETAGVGQRIVTALKHVSDLAGAAPPIDAGRTLPEAGVLDLIRGLVPASHHEWLENLAKEYELAVDTVTSGDGEVIAEPLFLARRETTTTAFYLRETPPSRPERFRLEDAGVSIGTIGEPPDSPTSGRGAQDG